MIKIPSTSKLALKLSTSLLITTSLSAASFSNSAVASGVPNSFLDKNTTGELKIDRGYVLLADDESSSAMTEALIERARRGVKVRLLLDYHSN